VSKVWLGGALGFFLLAGVVFAQQATTGGAAAGRPTGESGAGSGAVGGRPAEQILTQEVREQSIGRRTGRVARVVREEIVQELQENRLGSPEELARLGRMIDVLIVVANTHVPEVVDDLRSARAALETLLTQKHLTDASHTQQVILDLLAALVEKLAARERLSSLVEQAEELVARQQELNTDTRQTALKTIGKPLEGLKPEERQELTGLAGRQQDVRQRYQQLEGDIGRSAQQLLPSDARRARNLEAARDFGRSQRIEPTMSETAGELEQNQVLSAAQKEQQTLENLEALRDRLAEAEGNLFDELLRRQRDLENLITEQQGLRQDTGPMTPQSQPEALAALAQRQDNLAQRSGQLASELTPLAPQSSQNVSQAGEHMQEASSQLGQRQPAPAAAEQDQALQALAAAREALSLQLSQMAQMQMAAMPFDQRLLDILSQQREQLGLLQRIAEDLGALNELVARQEATGQKTVEEVKKPQGERQSQPLAATEKEVAARSGEVAQRIGQYDQESSGHVAKAQTQLEQAAGKLAQAQVEEARPPQEGGLAELRQGRDVLQDKFKRILDLLAQLQAQRRELAEGEHGQEEAGAPELGSLDELIQLANNLVELQRLTGDQEGTRDETAGAEPEQAEGLAPEQGQLKGRAEDLSQKAQQLTPEPAGQIGEAGQEMGHAAQSLGARLPLPAVGHQESALRSLHQAEQGMNSALGEMLQRELQMMAMMMTPSQTFDPRDEMRLRLAGLEALAEQAAAGTWRVVLPPQAREEVTQSLQDRFPKGYEALLRAYFQNLAQSPGQGAEGQ